MSPLYKGSAPFRIWAIDLALGLGRGRNGATLAVVAIDPFSKYILIDPLLNKSASTLADWFYTNVICEFGLTYIVRTDNGTEFRGSFAELLRDLKIH